MAGFKLAKGWRRWVMIVFIIVILALAIMAFSTGCSSSKTPSTTTPIGQLQANVSTLKAEIDTLDVTVWDHSNSITSLSTMVTTMQSNLGGYGERIANLEARNYSCNTTAIDFTTVNASLAMLSLRLSTLEAMNISTRLAALEAHATPTPAPNASVTPTPIPTPAGALTKPTAITPAVGNISVHNGSIIFQWTNCNASRYEFWFGNNSNNLVLIDELDSDVQSFLWPAPDSDTYYFWRIRAVVGTTATSGSFWFKTQ